MVLSVSFPRLKQPSYFCTAARSGVRRGMLTWRWPPRIREQGVRVISLDDALRQLHVPGDMHQDSSYTVHQQFRRQDVQCNFAQPCTAQSTGPKPASRSSRAGHCAARDRTAGPSTARAR